MEARFPLMSHFSLRTNDKEVLLFRIALQFSKTTSACIESIEYFFPSAFMDPVVEVLPTDFLIFI